MKEKIDALTQEINSVNCANLEEVENYRIKYLSKKGVLNDLFEAFKTVEPSQKERIRRFIKIKLKNLAQK
jgi:Aminoacyl tRNA synthetase class II, N-terminal domain.